MERIDVMQSDKALVMGILNCTPDSFYDGGRYKHQDTLKKRIDTLVLEGADIVDIGGQSTRPGADFLNPAEEWSRIQHAVEYTANEYPDIHLSVDTFHAEVARHAVECGASIINDVSGGQLDKEMFDAVAKLNVPYVLMHMKGTPSTMQNHCVYDDMMKEISDYFLGRMDELRSKGFNKCILDPGFGFAKNLDQNYALLRDLHQLKELNAPLLCGLSRKSMLYKYLDITPEGALNATIAAQTLALIGGCNILRVHDVKAAVECCKVVDKTGL